VYLPSLDMRKVCCINIYNFLFKAFFKFIQKLSSCVLMLLWLQVHCLNQKLVETQLVCCFSMFSLSKANGTCYYHQHNIVFGH